MERLNMRHLPQGTLTSPVRRAIMDWLRAHGPATADALREGLLARGCLELLMLEQRNPHWAEDHTYELFYAGHLQRAKADAGQTLYRVAEGNRAETLEAYGSSSPGRPKAARAPGTGAAGAPSPVWGSAPCEAGERGGTNLAAPRRIDVMNAPVLQSADAPPAREGALDYAAIPSLHMGQRMPHRAGRHPATTTNPT